MIIVTGGAGFIGSVLVYELNKRSEDRIIIVDDFEDQSKWLNLRGLKYDKVINIGEFYAMESWGEYRNANAIYHMGACSTTTEDDMDYLYENNFLCSRQLFNFATDRNIPFFYASSAATYGDGSLGYDDDESSITRLRSLNKYGYSKQLFDEWVLKKKNTPNVWFGFKFFNVFGPNEYHKGGMVSVPFQAFHQIKEKGQVRLFRSYRDGFADGEQKRDFVYVRDAVRAMLELEEVAKGRNDISGVYNLGSGQARSFNDLAHACFSSLGKPANIEYIDMPENVKNQYQYFTEANMDKLKEVLPNFSFLSLEEAIDDYIKNFLNRGNPYLDLDYEV